MTTESSKLGMMLNRAGTFASLYASLWVIKLVDWWQGLYRFITLNSYIKAKCKLRGLKDMDKSTEEESEKPSIDLMGFFYEHTCDAEDERDCSIMKHLILAEIRQSNAPAWVAEELEKKLECRGCWNALAKRAVIYPGSMAQNRFSANSRGYGPGKGTIPVKA
jgi:hypothetical protein